MSSSDSRGWIALAAVGVVLSFGPYLLIGTKYIELPLPYMLVRELPFMDTMRVPGRFALLGVLAICVLAAGSLASLTRRHPKGRELILLVCASILAIELWPGGLPGRPGGAPEPYSAIAEHAGAGAVLEIPLQWSTGAEVIGMESGDRNAAIFMAWATVHGKPYVGGSVSRYPDARIEQLYAIDVFRQVLAMQDVEPFEDRPTFDEQDLADLGIGYVVYHRDAPEPAVLDHMRSLDMPVLADDGTIIVWEVPED